MSVNVDGVDMNTSTLPVVIQTVHVDAHAPHVLPLFDAQLCQVQHAGVAQRVGYTPRHVVRLLRRPVASHADEHAGQNKARESEWV